ncbi:hypothetical protein TNCV_72011 [Trichonephila clavipes]|nr:hypothetical protein TNCV_72011 [Trichonephila clavipes]
MQIRHPETITHKIGLSFGEIVNLLRELSENESDGGELPCPNFDSYEGIRVSESDCKKSDESADDNILPNSDMYVSLGIAQNGYHTLVIFLVDLRQNRGTAIFAKFIVNAICV